MNDEVYKDVNKRVDARKNTVILYIHYTLCSFYDTDSDFQNFQMVKVYILAMSFFSCLYYTKFVDSMTAYLFLLLDEWMPLNYSYH